MYDTVARRRRRRRSALVSYASCLFQFVILFYTVFVCGIAYLYVVCDPKIHEAT